MQITGIILTGGKSRRMGSDKALLDLNGKTLLEHSIDLCKPFCENILISSNNTNHSVSGFEMVPDEKPDCGPMGGIYTCLKKSKTDWSFIISVDSPFVEPTFITNVLNEIGEFDAIIPIHSKGKEPLIALYHKNSLVEIGKMMEAENFKMHNLINSINVKWIESANWIKKYPKLFHNINRPEDLASLDVE